ncbi:MAG: NADPH:quinone oxidoreductase family protein [Rhodocyclaceae bacterium]|nr:NADPH:quinone oxidoreductase family protein [Rhodocyclaceae bacterium]
MKALQCTEFGPLENLRLAEVPDLVPAAGEVVIEVRAAGVNFPDALMVQGQYQVKPSLPFSPGMECAGVVRKLGIGVGDLRVGDRVAALLDHGAFAEQATASADRVFPIPAEVDFAPAAAFLLVYATAWHGLVNCARLQAGETLLVLGASGGVGLAAVQLGKQLGARVIAAASSTAKLDLCARNGADAGIDYVSEDLKTRVRELTDGQGADVIFDPVGGDLTEVALRSCAAQGRLLVVGFAAGAIPRLPTGLVLIKGCSVIGVQWGEYARRDPERYRADMLGLIERLALRQLVPHISATYPLQRGAEAIRSLLERRVAGKAVIAL